MTACKNTCFFGMVYSLWALGQFKAIEATATGIGNASELEGKTILLKTLHYFGYRIQAGTEL